MSATEREVLQWCVDCGYKPTSLCEVDEHTRVWAVREMSPVQVSGLRVGEEEGHVCGVCFMKPGSDSAQSMGCICPVYDNGRGHHTGRLVMVLGCPLHNKEVFV